MAFSDPQSITIAGNAKSMPRVSSDGFKSVYQNTDGTYRLVIEHQTTKNGIIRSTVRFENTMIAADPISSTNKSIMDAITITFTRPSWGFTETNVKDHAAGLFAWATATVVGQIFGQQS